MRLTPLLASLAFLLGATVAAAQPAAQASLSAPRLEYRVRTLDNGLTVYSMPDPSTATVTVQVWYSVGAKDDPQGRSGFAHLFEHILSRKTVNMPLGSMARLTEDIGGTRNASTAPDYTNYYETVPAAYLETMLWTHAERMARPVVDEAVFRAEREIVKEELRQRVLATPYGRLQRFVLFDNAFDRHPYRRPGIGSIEELDAATIDDARAFHEAYYRPDTATLVVSGNFDPAQLDAWVDRYFGPIARPAEPVRRYAAEPDPRRTRARQVTAYAPNVPLPAIVWSYQAPGASHPDAAALEVMDAILSQGRSSRLYRSLVYDRQVAASASTVFWQLKDASVYAPFVTVAGGKSAEEAEAALQAEISRMRSTLPTAAELAEAKTELIASQLRQRETASGRAFLLGDAVMTAGDPSLPDRRLADIQAVTARDVRRVARRWLNDAGRVSIRYFDESERPQGEADSWANPVPMPTYLTVPPATRPPNQLAEESVREQPPAPQATVPTRRPAVQERTLANGLRVVVARSSDVPLATMTLSAGGGSATDPEAKPGLATIATNVMMRGSLTRSATDIAAATERLGAVLGGGAGPDSASLFISAPTAVLDAAGEILADVAINPAFLEEEIERARKEALDANSVAMKQPGYVAGLVSARAVYGGAPYGAPSSGVEASLRALTRDDAAGWSRTWWRPENTTLVISGGVDAQAGFALAERLFGSWRGEGAAAQAPSERAGQARPPRVIVVDMPGAGQAAVVAALRGPSRSDPDFFPLSVANAVLGGGSNGRLFQEVRAKRGLSYGAYSALSQRRDEGTVTASAQTKNESAVEVAELFLAEIARIASEPVDAETIARRRAFLTGAFARQIETSTGLGAYLSALSAYGIGVGEIETFAASVDAVDAATAARVARERLAVDQAAIVIVGDAKAFIEGARAKWPDLVLIPADRLDLARADLRAETPAR